MRPNPSNPFDVEQLLVDNFNNHSLYRSPLIPRSLPLFKMASNTQNVSVMLEVALLHGPRNNVFAV